MTDCELGEELYDFLQQFQQDCNEEQAIRTAEAKLFSFECGGNSFEMGMICEPTLDLTFMDWYKSNQDLDFTVMLESWHRGFLEQKQREEA